MKRIKLLGLALVAVSAISAAAAAAASAAQPSFFQGGVPIAETKKIAFTSVNAKATGEVPTLETVGGKKVTCTSSTSKGEISGPTHVKTVVVTYKGCKSSGFACNTEGAAAEEIKTSTVEGVTAYVDAGHTKASIRFKPASGEIFAKFKCSLISVEVRGETFGEARPLNGVQSTSGELLFEQEKGKQKIRAEDEKAANIHLTTFGEESGIGGGATNAPPLKENVTFAEAVQLHT
jgi:hypothetical protein